MTNEKLLIEAFDGANGRSEVYEIVGKDPRGVERVTYEVVFNDQRQEVQSMGEASILASDLSGDSRFTSAH